MTAVTERALELIEQETPAQALPAVMPSNAVTPADLLRIAMERDDKDLDRLERLMEMQERYEQAQERDRQRQAMLAFRRDFAAFRGENIVVGKTKHVDRGKAGSFDQAEFHVAANLLSPALSAHGFSFRHDQKFGSKPWTTDGVVSDIPWVYVTCHLEHREGYAERLDLEGPPGDLSANTPTQNMQATASYLKRQSLFAITGTATGGEDDENKSRMRGTTASADEPDEAYVQAFRDASLQGTEALRKHYQNAKPSDEWWTANSRALKAAAKRADEVGAQA